jgi:phage-related protein (TIGR01555 family)
MKVSAKAAARQAVRDDAQARKVVLNPHTGSSLAAAEKTVDSFINFAQKLGIGSDSPLSTASYAYNPITRNRNLLEWIHRGSWIGGQVIDIIANDMTRAGVVFSSEMEPDDAEAVETRIRRLGVWDKLNETLKWGRLYGGAIAVMLVDGQDPRTPLRLDSIGRDQFKGILALDRWQLEPALEDLVTEMGPDLGLPKFYRVTANAPALRGAVIHHSRIALRHVGVELPYQQALTENLWGVSVLERLYDRMVGFDSASTGVAQLVYKCFLRTLKVKDLRSVIAAGGKAMTGLAAYAEVMRKYQGIEGLTLIDAEDELDVQTTSAFSGMADALNQLGQQLSGATGIPLTRLFGQSPSGFSTGDADIRNYYDGIAQQQQKLMLRGVTTVYELAARSEGVQLPDNYMAQFAPLWQLDDKEKAEVAERIGNTVAKQVDAATIGRQTALRELRQASRITGVFSNITSEMIDAADDEVLPPDAELAMQQEHDMTMQTQQQKHQLTLTDRNNKSKTELAKLAVKNKEKANAGSKREAKPVAGRQKRGAFV